MPTTGTLSKDGSIHVTDEFWNTLISCLGALLAAAGSLILVVKAIQMGQTRHAVCVAVYGMTLVTMFSTSTLHHLIDGSERTNHWLRQLDHFAIYLLIAGTFTPFSVIALSKELGQWITILIWVLALIGIITKWRFPNMPRIVSTAYYVGMGWIGAVVVYQLYQKIGWVGISGLVIGGLLYTIGAVIYALEKPNLVPGKFGFHEMWHLFVLLASAAHFYAVSLLLAIK